MYMLDTALRRRVVTTPQVFTVAECESLFGTVEEAVAARGGWDTDRHGAYPTTDIAVRPGFPPSSVCLVWLT